MQGASFCRPSRRPQAVGGVNSVRRADRPASQKNARIAMNVNDLIELLEYCDRRVPVSVGLATAHGDVVTCDQVRLIAERDRVFLVVDGFPEVAGLACEMAGMKTGEVSRADYDCPQIFGQRLILLKKPELVGGPPETPEAEAVTADPSGPVDTPSS
jgi:hypothetical protein